MKKLLLSFLLTLLITDGFAQPTVGLVTRTATMQDGYVLFPPMFSNNTYLINKCGREVHSWRGSSHPGVSAYLLPDGTLLRPANAHNTTFNFGGTGGIIQRLDWNSNPVWSYTISSAQECQHHDVCYMPNGNILAIVWELKSDVDAIAMGRDPGTIGATIWPDKIVELEPAGFNSANIVWEWRAWDHLVQDFDSTLPNYGAVSDHPELLNINQPNGKTVNPDWMHVNSVAYNRDRDEIILSSYYFNEIWIIDHGTTKTEARGHTGGKRGKGGDLLYRWGNPEAYGRGDQFDRKFYEQHDPQWIPAGYPDAGKIIVYNNGAGRPDGDYSTVEVLAPPMDASGNYLLPPGGTYGPTNPSWEYKAPHPPDFYSAIISGAERLSNGNTLICEGTKGRLFEVDMNKNKVWEYVNPVGIVGITTQGNTPNQNFVFRMRQYPANYPGFHGHTLTPKAPIELKPLPQAAPCASTTEVATITGLNPVFHATNPFGNTIALKSDVEAGDAQIMLLNSLGMICGQWQQDIQAGKTSILRVAGDLPSGLYALRIINKDTRTTIKLVRE